MSPVSKKWIKENVSFLSGFGGQITLDNFEDLPALKGGHDTTLTKKGLLAVENGLYTEKFHIYLGGGLGWADAYGKNELGGPIYERL